MFSCVSLNSKDSLEEFLPLYQCKDAEKRKIYKKEREIVRYLKSLGLQMNTDPLKKLQQVLNHKLVKDPSSDSEIETNLDLQVKPKEDCEFVIANNPLLKRGSRRIIRTFSFEKKDVTSQNSINESTEI